MASYDNEKLPPIETKSNVRYAEKRRTSTCRFADRVAEVSIDLYRRLIPEDERLPQTCLATIVAHDSSNDGNLIVVGMGVGTKFLSESFLRDESSSSHYGRRVRDCHAEVLARRAFRRQLTLEILQDLQQAPQMSCNFTGIVERSPASDSSIRFCLRPGVTLHLYSSSAPCGNATLKKFAKMSKERFRAELSSDEWPQEPHQPIHGSSVHLGQFALLIKKDSDAVGDPTDNEADGPKANYKSLLASTSDDWAPPGTTTVSMLYKGSIHTCSDKICRWNYLGLQGSLLASLLTAPIYISTMTVGRKFTECICRRAICCRVPKEHKNKRLRRSCNDSTKDSEQLMTPPVVYTHNHPAVMGTAVYMDESGVVETSSDVRGQDVRFHSSRSWCWWPLLDHEVSPGYVECIDGSSGFLWQNELNDDDAPTDHVESVPPRVSTESLTRLYLQAFGLSQKICREQSLQGYSTFTLTSLQHLKSELSSDYELSKDELLSHSRIFRQWRRRFKSNGEDMTANTG